MCPDPRARAGTAPFRIDKAPGNWLLTHSAAPRTQCNALRRVSPPARFGPGQARTRRKLPASTCGIVARPFREALMPNHAIGGYPRRPFGAWVAAAAFACAVAVLSPATAAEDELIPNFAPDSVTGWLKP